jgi:hypothetical protein
MQAFRNDCFLADVAKGLVRRRHEYYAAAFGVRTGVHSDDARKEVLETRSSHCVPSDIVIMRKESVVEVENGKSQSAIRGCHGTVKQINISI